MDLPEGIGIHAFQDFAQRCAYDGFFRGAYDTGTAFARLEEEHVFNRDELDLVASRRGDPGKLRQYGAGRWRLAVLARGRQPRAESFQRGLEALWRHRLEDVVDRAQLEGTNGMLVVGGGEDDLGRRTCLLG